jgi:PhnB protein
MRLNPYLNFGGNCVEAMSFYREHLGGKLCGMMKFSDAPDRSMVPPDSKDQVMWSQMSFGDSLMMACDAPGDRFEPSRGVYMSLSVDSIEEAERVHGVLAEGGEVFMPMTETFFAFRFSMMRDKFGTLWMVIHERPMPSA